MLLLTIGSTYFIRVYTYNAYTGDFTICVNDGQVGISSVFAERNVEVYPNPTNGQLFIVNANDDFIYVYNLIGELIMSTKGTNTITNLNLSNFAKGTYYLQIKNNKEVITKKIVISN